jgi:two-component system sensor histidine kinase ChvG
LKRYTASDIAIVAPERDAALGQPDRRPTERWTISPITRRILTVNLLALAFLVAGMLYLDAYRRQLITAQLATLEDEAQLFAAAIVEGATFEGIPGSGQINSFLAQQMVRRLVVETEGLRARLFAGHGGLIADSSQIRGPAGVIQAENLPPPEPSTDVTDILASYDRLLQRWLGRDQFPPHEEQRNQRARDYPEVTDALQGKPANQIRALPDGGLMLNVAVPVRRHQKVVGSLMLSRDSTPIDVAMLRIRMDILKWFLVALAVTVLLSLYLAGTIARPIRRLAEAAEHVRRDRHGRHTIPNFGDRRDEIGQLAGALREMTEALRLRIDAIERFAADVAHEIKNPLTSLRSAVETAARIDDPDQRQKLMAIIQDDVSRLDRLISDISDASRLDAELSRAQAVPVDIGKMLALLRDVSESSANERAIRMQVDIAADADLVVEGIEGRLVQVFRNLIANALSFSPAGGTITLSAHREGNSVIATIGDEGPGIPPGRENEIFSRFYSERPRTEKFGVHSGLGLSISKQIVEAHGGSIVAENRRDADGTIRGARFVVDLPVA